jgi:hypothetical protein
MQKKININIKKSNKYIYFNIYFKNMNITTINLNKSFFNNSIIYLFELLKESGINIIYSKSNILKQPYII